MTTKTHALHLKQEILSQVVAFSAKYKVDLNTVNIVIENKFIEIGEPRTDLLIQIRKHDKVTYSDANSFVSGKTITRPAGIYTETFIPDTIVKGGQKCVESVDLSGLKSLFNEGC